MEQMLTIDEVAELLSVKPMTVRGWITREGLPRLKIGPVGSRGTIRIPRKGLEEWVGSRLGVETSRR